MNSSGYRFVLIIVCILALCAVPVMAKDTALIYSDNPDPANRALAASVTKQIIAAGYEVRSIDSQALCDEKLLDVSKVDLLVIPNASVMPSRASYSVGAYLKSGGDIIALQAPMWQKSVIKAGKKWITREEYSLEHAGDTPDTPMPEFSAGQLSRWGRSTDNFNNPTTAKFTSDSPTPGASSMHVVLPIVTNWDTLCTPELNNPFAGGKSLTVFSAKGIAATPNLAVEWIEKDGSRWIATIRLTTKWRRYVLAPQDFQFYQSSTGRNFIGDCFNPANAAKISFGLAAQTHTGPAVGRQEYWIANLGYSTVTPELKDFANTDSQVKLDTLSPAYKMFTSTSASTISATSELLGSFKQMVVSGSVRSPQPRPSGGGFNKGRDWRWIALLEARNKNGEWRGSPLTCFVNADGPYKGGIWVSCGITDPMLCANPSVLKAINEAAVRMRRGLFILDGGSNFYTYYADQSIKLGTRIVNLGKKTYSAIPVQITLVNAKTGESYYSKQSAVTVKTGETFTTSGNYTPKSWPKAGMVARVKILAGGTVIDRVSNTVDMWQPKDKKEFLTVKDGQFFLKGKRWKVNGTNYMPSSGIGTEDGGFFEFWTGARAYDPVVIERDLRHLQDMGINSVSIFTYSDFTEDQNLLDILRRLEKKGMKANLSLRPGTPMNFMWDQISRIINYYKLWENDTVFAYDLAWEPNFGSHQGRQMWDTEWTKWVVERYGSIENAEKGWSYPIPRNEGGGITNPRPNEIETDGAWRQMTAAYRRFLDTLLYKQYSQARRLVRSIDPNHLVSFRMAYAGDPTFKVGDMVTYDFPYLAAAVDFLAPEAYGRIGNWENVKHGWFEWKYAKWAAPEKPMLWTEMGVSIWDITTKNTPKSSLQLQSTFFSNFYKLMNATGMDGVYYWWYAGGFRVGENSDYGIINSDGSDRLATSTIRSNASTFLKSTLPKGKSTPILFDRDQHPIGITGIYDTHKAEFWDRINKGLDPVLITKGTGTDSTNCPLTAVGNTECNGTNPPKYLDATFDIVQVQTSNGQWTNVAKNGEVTLEPADLARARVTIMNLGEATLISALKSDKPGAVYITVTSPTGTRLFPLPTDLRSRCEVTIDDLVVYGGEVTIGLLAKDRTGFGEKFGFVVKE